MYLIPYYTKVTRAIFNRRKNYQISDLINQTPFNETKDVKIYLLVQQKTSTSELFSVGKTISTSINVT